MSDTEHGAGRGHCTATTKATRRAPTQTRLAQPEALGRELRPRRNGKTHHTTPSCSMANPTNTGAATPIQRAPCRAASHPNSHHISDSSRSGRTLPGRPRPPAHSEILRSQPHARPTQLGHTSLFRLLEALGSVPPCHITLTFATPIIGFGFYFIVV
jgi:hypothetical protein